MSTSAATAVQAGPVLRFPVSGTPVPQGSKTALIAGKRIKCREGVMVLNPYVNMVEDGNRKTKTLPKDRLKDWRNHVAVCARTACQRLGLDLLESFVALSVEFVLPRPKSHLTKSGRLTKSAPAYPGKPDLSKLVRAVEDALTGVVWRDDSLVVEYRSVTKRYAVPGGKGGALVEVVAL